MGATDEYDELLSLVQRRRSVRHFLPDPIPDGYVGKMIDVARWAPSGFHSQPWEFVVIKDGLIKEKIATALRSAPPAPAMCDETNPAQPSQQPGFADAPVFILLAGDWRARVQFSNIPQPGRDRAEADVFLSSLANAFLYLHLAAASLGLASQWCSSSAAGPSGAAVRDILGLPDYIRTYDMMAVGYAAEAPLVKEVRDLKDMIHYDACGPDDIRTADKLARDTRRFTAWCVKAH